MGSAVPGILREQVGSDPRDVIEAMYASFSRLANGGEIEAHVAAYYAPDAEYHPVEEATPIRGWDELVRWHERWFDAWDELQAHAEEVVRHEETVLTSVSVRARGAGSGADVQQAFFHVAEVRDQRIERLREYLDRRAAMKAAGLPRQPGT